MTNYNIMTPRYKYKTIKIFGKKIILKIAQRETSRFEKIIVDIAGIVTMITTFAIIYLICVTFFYL